MPGLGSIVAEGKIAVVLALDSVRSGRDNGIGDDDYRAQWEVRALVRDRSCRYAGDWYGREAPHTDTLGRNEKAIWCIVTVNTCGRTKVRRERSDGWGGFRFSKRQPDTSPPCLVLH